MLNIGKKLFSLYHSHTSQPPSSTSREASPLSMSAPTSHDGNKWKLTNLAGIASDDDKDLRHQAAASEAAFEHAGQTPGIEVWRIEKFEPQKLDNIRADNLSMYSGDCYIILKTTERDGGDALDWQLHYWIGKDSTQDEWTAASYFTVNLDDLLQQKVRSLKYPGSGARGGGMAFSSMYFWGAASSANWSLMCCIFDPCLMSFVARAASGGAIQRIGPIPFLFCVCYVPGRRN